MSRLLFANTPAPQVDDELFEWMCTARRFFHRHPELGFQEERAARYIQDRLLELGIPFRSGVAKTGVVGSLGSVAGEGRRVALRADLDALPLQEKTGLPFASIHDGLMHACGHDGHAAMLLGAAALLKSYDLPGRVELLFQPAEENGRGAAEIIGEGIIDEVDAIFAGHIDTHFATGIITVDPGVICAWADPFSITIRGQSGHAARPHEATDAVVASASLITALQTLVSRETNPHHSAVVSIGKVKAGVAHNVVADEAHLDGTLRATDPESRSRTLRGIERVVSGIATLHGVEVEVKFQDNLPAVVNSPIATEIARKAAIDVVGEVGVISQGSPSLGGEDFSFYQQRIEGCMVRFGALQPGGIGPAHSSTFDFDENVLRVGAAWLATAALTWLAR